MKQRKTVEPGTTSGRLTALSDAGAHPTSGNTMVRCLCSCGNESVKAWSAVCSGRAKSCGCLRVEQAKANGFASRKHGMRNTKEYATWRGIFVRCYDENAPNYPKYGGRGITVCERWHTFENFYADMGARPDNKHSIDRIDVDGPYSPENCRWATNNEQQRNKQNTVLVEWAGEKLCVREWEDRLGFPKEVIYNRLRSGWLVERAMTEPLHTEKSRNQTRRLTHP